MLKRTDFSFQKNFRLITKQDFLHLKKGSKKFSTENLIVYFKHNKNNIGHARLGIAVSTKVGKANVRNRFKRVIRGHFRIEKMRDTNLDILFVVSKKILKNNSLKNAVSFIKKDLISAGEEFEKHI